MRKSRISQIQILTPTLGALLEIDTPGASALHKMIVDNRWSRGGDVRVSSSILAQEYDGTRGLELVHEAAMLADNKSTARLCKLIADDLDGVRIDDRKAKSVEEAKEILKAHIRSSPRSWVFKVAKNGFLTASAAVNVEVFEDDEDHTKELILTVMFNDGMTSTYRFNGQRSGIKQNRSIRAAEARGKTGEQLLDLFGYFIGDDEMIKDYEEQTAYQDEIISELSSQQFTMHGVVESESDSLFFQDEPDNRHNDRLQFSESINRSGEEVERKVILCDSVASLESDRISRTNSLIFDTDDEDDQPVLVDVPSHHVMRVFDTSTLTYLCVHSNSLEEYEYDEQITDRIILPDSHRDLLDVLTSDLDTINHDIIEGKGGGTMILCKGEPGLGKTLTAEAYSEMTHRPLLAIHSGIIGVRPRIIRENLRIAFDLARRFNAILLLDEADVFVLKRGNSHIQNAIVAEFLRVLEYFDDLLFMTTNRSEDIDDAIESRSAAIIHYTYPDADDLSRTWIMFAELFDAPLDKKLVQELVETFPNISQRSVKMLFRLTLRFVRSRGEKLTLDSFKRMAIFRGIDMQDEDE